MIRHFGEDLWSLLSMFAEIRYMVFFVLLMIWLRLLLPVIKDVLSRPRKPKHKFVHLFPESSNLPRRGPYEFPSFVDEAHQPASVENTTDETHDAFCIHHDAKGGECAPLLCAGNRVVQVFRLAHLGKYPTRILSRACQRKLQCPTPHEANLGRISALSWCHGWGRDAF